MPPENWSQVEGQDWELGTWSAWVKAKPGRRLVLSVPLLVGGWDGKGPASGPGAHQPVSLEEGAKGTYNDHFRVLAEHLVQRGLGDTVLRLGWEFNGGWYSWRAQSEDKAVAFAGYFKQIVTTMRAVPGAEKLTFVWNPCLIWTNYSLEKAWPGDEYVDYVGVDVYDDSWAPNTYPIPADATQEEADTIHQKVWNDIILNDKNHGLALIRDLAARHGNKPLAIPEWGRGQPRRQAGSRRAR
ncbi:MAG: glycosyl hydrolase [Verrucomicrobiota bacterium]